MKPSDIPDCTTWLEADRRGHLIDRLRQETGRESGDYVGPPIQALAVFGLALTPDEITRLEQSL